MNEKMPLKHLKRQVVTCCAHYNIHELINIWPPTLDIYAYSTTTTMIVIGCPIIAEVIYIIKWVLNVQ